MLSTKSIVNVEVRRAIGRTGALEMFSLGIARTHVEALEARNLLSAWSLEPLIEGNPPAYFDYTATAWGYTVHATLDDGSIVDSMSFEPVLDESILPENATITLDTFISQMTADFQQRAIEATGDSTIEITAVQSPLEWDEDGNPVGDRVMVSFYGNGGTVAQDPVDPIDDEFDPEIYYMTGGNGDTGLFDGSDTATLVDFAFLGTTDLHVDDTGTVTAVANGIDRTVTIDENGLILVDGANTDYRVRFDGENYSLEAAYVRNTLTGEIQPADPIEVTAPTAPVEVSESVVTAGGTCYSVILDENGTFIELYRHEVQGIGYACIYMGPYIKRVGADEDLARMGTSLTIGETVIIACADGTTSTASIVDAVDLHAAHGTIYSTITRVPLDDAEFTVLNEMWSIVAVPPTETATTSILLADFRNWGVTEISVDTNGVVTAIADGEARTVTIDPDTREISVDGTPTSYMLAQGRESGFTLNFIEPIENVTELISLGTAGRTPGILTAGSTDFTVAVESSAASVRVSLANGIFSADKNILDSKDEDKIIA